MGSVKAVYTRGPRDPSPVRAERVEAVSGVGIAGDRHASSTSPRQVLIAAVPTYEQVGLEATTLRETLCVDFSVVGLGSGDLIRVGSQVVLWLTFHCEPCGRLDRRHPGLSRIIGKHRGMLARVLRGGAIEVGDDVSLWRAALPPISEEWQTRVLDIVRAVPDGHHIGYPQLAQLAGVAPAYCRAFPRVLSKLPFDVSRRVVAAGSVVTGSRWSGTELFDVASELDLALD